MASSGTHISFSFGISKPVIVVCERQEHAPDHNYDSGEQKILCDLIGHRFRTIIQVARS